jgi:hypothetical protein
MIGNFFNVGVSEGTIGTAIEITSTKKPYSDWIKFIMLNPNGTCIFDSNLRINGPVEGLWGTGFEVGFPKGNYKAIIYCVGQKVEEIDFNIPGGIRLDRLTRDRPRYKWTHEDGTTVLTVETLGDPKRTIYVSVYDSQGMCVAAAIPVIVVYKSGDLHVGRMQFALDKGDYTFELSCNKYKRVSGVYTVQ